MRRSITNICFIALIAYFAGAIVGATVLIQWRSNDRKKRSEQKGQAFTFFYKTMNDLFEGTYNPQDDAIYKDALKEFRKYEPRLGKKCLLYIGDANPSYYEGTAIFPSGDLFYVYISRMGKRYEIIRLRHEDWDGRWRHMLDLCEIEPKE